MSETRTDTLRLAEQAEAEAAEADAQAAAARERAQQLRKRRATEQADAVVADAVVADAAVADADETEAVDDAEINDPRTPRWWRRGSLWRTVAESAAGITVLALIGASAFFLYADRQMDKDAADQAEFAAAARQGVINLMSLDFNNAQADIQRVIDSTTGEFHDDFASSTGDFLTVMEESQVVTTATVNATAVETLTEDSAVVLVAATSQVANSVSKQPNPRIWRLSVSVDRVGDQIKMSKVEFVP